VQQGDRQAPEGFYTIAPEQLNPHSQYYLAFDLGYPNAFDRAYGRTGGNLMVHGACASAGCYAMTDEQISEIYALARESFFGGQRSFQVQAYPFRMTPTNMAKHRDNPNMPFWEMLKEGNDHFEVTRQEPKVDVCEKRYVFDAELPTNTAVRQVSFNPIGTCPAYQVRRGSALPSLRNKGRTTSKRRSSSGTERRRCRSEPEQTAGCTRSSSPSSMRRSSVTATIRPHRRRGEAGRSRPFDRVQEFLLAAIRG
jgi:hypothetical protein